MRCLVTPEHDAFDLFQPVLSSGAVQPPTLNEAFVEEVKSTGIPFSHDAEDRVFRAHGKAPPPSTNHLPCLVA